MINNDILYYDDKIIEKINVVDLIKKKNNVIKNINYAETLFSKNIPFLHFHPKVQKLIEHPYIEQQSDEWFRQREGTYVTASEVSHIIEKSKYETPSKQELFEDKTGFKKRKFESDATKHGNFNEPKAAQLYCLEMGEPLIKLGLIKWQKNHFIGASLDRVSIFSGRNIEIKCPYSARVDVERANENSVIEDFPDYWHQMQLQMLVSDLDETHFIRYGTNPNRFHLEKDFMTITKISKYENWWEDYKDPILSFIDEILNYHKRRIDDPNLIPPILQSNIIIKPSNNKKRKFYNTPTSICDF